MDIQSLLILLLVLESISLVLLLFLLLRTPRHDSDHVLMQWQDIENDLLRAIDDSNREHWQGLHQLSDAFQATLAQSAQHASQEMQSLSQQLSSSLTRQDETISRLQQSLLSQLSMLDARMEKTRASTLAAMDSMQASNERSLQVMRETVDEKLTATLERRLTDSFQSVSKRLDQVYQGLGEMQALAGDVGDLRRVLSNVKARGIWGEMQLGALLSQMLSASQYAENVEIVPGSGERVEFAVCLPGKDNGIVYLPIDSKFPQETYVHLMDARDLGDAEAVREARKALDTAIRIEARRISQKYICAPYSTDFAIMFLPVEGLYAEVVRDMDNIERIQREQRIVIAGPSNLTALLSALQMGFKTLAIEARTGEVWRLLGRVRTDFSGFESLLRKTQRSLQQATDSIDRAVNHTQSIQKSLGAVEDLDPTQLSSSFEDAIIPPAFPAGEQ